MKVSEILELPAGVKEVASVEAIVGFVNDVKLVEDKVAGKYKFYAQKLQLVDGDTKIYIDITANAKMDLLDRTASGKRVDIRGSEKKGISIEFYVGKDGNKYKCLKGGRIWNDIPQESKKVIDDFQAKKDANLRQLQEIEEQEKLAKQPELPKPGNEGAKWGCALHCASRIVAAAINAKVYDTTANADKEVKRLAKLIYEMTPDIEFPGEQQ